MPVSIRFLGTAAFQITTASGGRILIDPYLDENPVSPVKVADLERLDLLRMGGRKDSTQGRKARAAFDA